MQEATSLQLSRAHAWLIAAQPEALPAAAVPVLVGTAVAWRAGHFRFWPFAAALVSSVLILLGTHFANDLFDFQKGADTPARIGLMRVTQSGLIAPHAMARATALAFGAAGLVGLYLVWVGGLPILIVGLASITVGITYTGGPYPLGYHGLGDLCDFVFLGLIAVMGSDYIQTGVLRWTALVAAIPVGLLVTGLIVVNNVRDIETDRPAGKHTLAVHMGREATRVYYLALLVVAYAMPLVLWLIGGTSWLFWLPWLTAPLAVRLVRTVFTHTDGPALNEAFKKTGLLHLLFGLLLTVGILFP